MYDLKSLIPFRLSHFLDSATKYYNKKRDNYFILCVFLEAGDREECDSKLKLTTTSQQDLHYPPFQLYSS